MNKPMGYDEAQASGEFTPVELGGHYCIIKQVKETQSSSGKPMVVVCLDFAPEDKQKGYFSESFKNDVRPDKKWPHNGTAYIMTQDYKDPSKTSRNFKTFCTSFENSNPGLSIQWGGNDWGAQFKNRKIGAVYGAVENEYNGKRTMRHELRWFCSWDRVANASVPKDKLLPDAPASTPITPANPWEDHTSNDPNQDEEIPF